MPDRKTFIKFCKEATSMRQASVKLKLPFTTFRRHAVRLGCYRPNQGRKGIPRTNLDVVLTKASSYSTGWVKHLLFNAGLKKHTCEKCTHITWNKLPIPLELHHIDGDNTNHSLSNLEILCPNCHAQTDNYRRSKKYTRGAKVTRYA